jgi:L-arabinokinase
VTPSVAFYISGHGFGHASRQVEIINAFGLRHPETRICVRSAAARWLLERTIRVPFQLDDRPCDTGVVQIDSLHLDAGETIARAADFYATIDARAADEARLLRDRGARLAIVDAAPLGCAAAAAAGIPSVVVSNFTWDWIYAAYREHLHLGPDVIPAIERAYRQAHAAWRLPMYGGFETFASSRDHASAAPPVRDVPFVARHARHGRDETRQKLGLPRDARLVLPTFGGYGAQGVDYAQLDFGPDWQVLVNFDDRLIYESGLRYEDLVGAVDVVFTKPGYGIISECIANDTALVYTSRGRFAEYDVLVREMPRYLRCAFVSQEDLVAGRWRAAADAALTAPAPPDDPATNGAEVIVGLMESVLALEG